MDKCVFDNGRKCEALRKKKCEGCTFYKTEDKLNEGRWKSFERIDSLPEKQRLHIIRKYYK